MKGVVTFWSTYCRKASAQLPLALSRVSRFLILTRIGPATCQGTYSPTSLAASALTATKQRESGNRGGHNWTAQKLTMLFPEMLHKDLQSAYSRIGTVSVLVTKPTCCVVQ